MSKTPSIDSDSTDHDSSVTGVTADTKNPLSALVSEVDEFDGIEVAPTFRSLRAPELPGRSQASESEFDRDFNSDSKSEIYTPARTQNASVKVSTASAELPLDPSDAAQPRLNRSSTQNLQDQIDIPPRSGISATAVTSIETPEPQASVTPAPVKRRSMRGLIACAALLLAFVGTGYLYVQGSDTASSETVVYEAPIFDDEIASNAAPKFTTDPALEAPETPVVQSITPAVVTRQSGNEVDAAVSNLEQPPEVVAVLSPSTAALPTEATAKPKPFGFNDKFSDEFPELEGQSLLDLATGVAIYGPAETVPASEWDEVSCGGCHAFNQANLCEQGAYYFNHDKARTARIQHPYGGGFKLKLMEWAEGGCR